MKCLICKKSDEETEVVRGIYEGKVIPICEKCAKIECVPIIKKASEEQWGMAQTRRSVRERMEKMSGMGKRKSLTKEQIIIHSNLLKLRIPEKKQDDPKLVDNYYWKIKMERRNRKLSINQVSEQTGINTGTLTEIEKGILPEDMENILLKLESFFDIVLIKRTHENQKQKIENGIINIDEKIKEKKQENAARVLRGELNFSKKKEIDNLNINDLVDLKKRRDIDDMFGDDIEVEG